MKSKQKSLDKYVLYLETLNSSTINSLDDYVAENVRFKDPFNDVMGSEKMKAVFLHMFGNVEDVKFNVHRIYRNNDGGCLEWSFCGRLMNRNWSFDGTSIIILDNNLNSCFNPTYNLLCIADITRDPRSNNATVVPTAAA